MSYCKARIPEVRIDPQYTYRSEPVPNRHADGSAGTKYACKYCGHKTYRSVGGIPCCVDCTPKGRAESEKGWRK